MQAPYGDPTSVALVAIVGAVITALISLLKDNTRATNALVEETRTGNREAKERNGHLGEQNVQIAQLVTSQSADITAIKMSLEQSATTLVRTEAAKAADTREVRATLARK